RHRHRYEFNNEYRDEFGKIGMQIVGTSPDNRLVEAIEYDKNDFYVGVQFHPEFKSRPDKAHPIFKEFITAATKVKRS
ncbi:MAG: gamma-glutamyl-gamma-aminobutyrate hydrolase family protein, partial [Bacilli bacterium]|nr:gamma-glutamyl-gamma-aminobutyrate hydrolase family protein [Bacilli bacterium]